MSVVGKLAPRAAQDFRDEVDGCWSAADLELELTKRDKVNLDIFWRKDAALEKSANLPAPEIIAADIKADLEAALEQFATIAEDLK